jgi:hypothetical protein
LQHVRWPASVAEEQRNRVDPCTRTEGHITSTLRVRPSRGWHDSPVRAPRIALLTIALVAALSVPAQAQPEHGWGSTGAADRTLKPGCATYNYHYRLTPPPGDWMLETFLLDPNKKRVASGYFLSAADPVKGQSKFAFCGLNTVPGVFTIRAKLTVSNPNTRSGWLKASTFRLRAPR